MKSVFWVCMGMYSNVIESVTHAQNLFNHLLVITLD